MIKVKRSVGFGLLSLSEEGAEGVTDTTVLFRVLTGEVVVEEEIVVGIALIVEEGVAGMAVLLKVSTIAEGAALGLVENGTVERSVVKVER